MWQLLATTPSLQIVLTHRNMSDHAVRGERPNIFIPTVYPTQHEVQVISRQCQQLAPKANAGLQPAVRQRKTAQFQQERFCGGAAR